MKQYRIVFSDKYFIGEYIVNAECLHEAKEKFFAEWGFNVNIEKVRVFDVERV